MSVTASGALAFVLPFFICVSAIVVLRKIAVHIGLLDKPCERKQHEGLVPLVGGIAMFAAFSFATLLLNPSWNSTALISIALIVTVLGVFDDFQGLQTRKRFLVQILAAAAMVLVGGVQINQLGNIFGNGTLYFGSFMALLFTVFSTVGVINAMNMVDGADGLAGSLAVISLSALAFIAFSAGDYANTQLLLTIIGALCAFLLFNIRFFGRRARVFMGDAGSMFLGFALAWFFIDLSQGETISLSAVSAGWILGLPLLDISALMVRRLIDGRSPFEAGRDHIHHLLIDRGYSVNKTLQIIVLMQIAFVGVGIYANNKPQWEPAFFFLFILLVAVHIVYTYKVIKSQKLRLASASNSAEQQLRTDTFLDTNVPIRTNSERQQSEVHS